MTSSQHFGELVTCLATILDAIEGRQQKGKDYTKIGRLTRKVGIRVWRVLREVRSIRSEVKLEMLTEIPASVRLTLHA